MASIKKLLFKNVMKGTVIGKDFYELIDIFRLKMMVIIEIKKS